MYPTKSLSLAVAAISLLHIHASDFKAYDYTTPAYIDLEIGEIHVNEPAGNVSINIIRSGDFRQTSTIEYSTVEENASEGVDYKGAGGTLVFKPGEGYKTITLQVLNDDEVEERETFRFELTSSDPNVMLMRRTATIVIDEPARPISQPQLQIAAAGSGKIRLSWDGSDRCSLERTTNPTSGTWERVECAPTVTAKGCEVLEPLGGTFYFYRLRLP